MEKVAPDDIIVQIGQSIDWLSLKWCWLISIMNWVATLTNYKLSKKDLTNFVKFATDRGIENEWGDKIDWVPIVLEWFNSRGIDTIRIRKIPIFWNMFWKYLDLWYPIIVSIWSSDQYKEDRRDNLLDYPSYSMRWRNWHAIMLQKIWWEYYLVDSNWKLSKYKLLSKEWMRKIRWLRKNKETLVITYK